MATETTNKIDEDLHSRQLAVYGRHAMGKMSATKVLIAGVNGLGAEIAKNVILAQVHSVTLQDTESTTLADLGSHFYLTEADVGKNRAESCVQRLQELNPTVQVSATSKELSEELIKAHDVVVLIGSTRAQAETASDWCRARSPPARLTWCGVMGLFAFVCNDFGESFVVSDTTGENPRSAIIANIVQGEETLVSCVDDERIDFEEGDIVKLLEVEGMDGLEDVEFKVKDVSKTSFKVGDTTKYKAYIKGGTVVQQKQPKTLKFAPVRDAFSAPQGEMLETDWSKFGRPQLLLLALEAVEQFRLGNDNQLPALGNQDEAEALLKIAKEINDARADDKKIDNLDDNAALFRALAYGARAVLNPMAAFFGGVIGQEVVKAASGKFHPIHQWLLFESLESVDPKHPHLPPDEYIAKGDAEERYAHQIAVIGRQQHQKLQALKIFMVGAGALGCEFLKNFAMMGVATAEDGLLTLTDDDTIERSNLSRQFLFRNSDVGKSKSDAAAKATKAMNPNINLKPMQDRVSPLTEHIFNDEFWKGLSFVTNALDNVKARLYVDRRCVFFNKALFESGTLGTKCNTQVVIPHITENYGASRDPQEKMVPDCTLHNFPHNIQHCLSWARSEFIGQFTDRPRSAQQFAKADSAAAFVQELKNAGTASGELAQTVDGLASSLGARPKDFGECVAWARILFEEYFVRKILQLVHLYPEDATTKSGMPFWSPPKRFPKAASFDDQDELHMGFIVSAANLRAVTMGVAAEEDKRRDFDYIRSLLSKVEVPEWKPSDSAKIKLDEANGGDPNAQDEEEQTDEQALAQKLEALPKPSELKVDSFDPQEFEKDDATNFHMDFIHTVANLRAFNYQVKGVDALQSKLIAGRIIPAIATTTAAATGLVCLEIYKYLREAKFEAYRNAFVNLALPLFSLIEPMGPAKVKSRTEKRTPDPINHPEYVEEEEITAYPEDHTVWDHLVVDEGDLTVQEFIDYFKNKHNFTVSSIAIPIMTSKGESAAMLYSAYIASTKQRLPKKITEVYEQLTKQPIGDRKYILPSCLFEDADYKTVETPEIIYQFKK